MPLPARLFAVVPSHFRFSSLGEPVGTRVARICKTQFCNTLLHFRSSVVPLTFSPDFIYVCFTFRLIMLLRTHATDWNIPGCGNRYYPNGRRFVVSMYVCIRLLFYRAYLVVVSILLNCCTMKNSIYLFFYGF